MWETLGLHYDWQNRRNTEEDKDPRSLLKWNIAYQTLLIFKGERSNESGGDLNIGSERKSTQLIRRKRESREHRARIVPVFKSYVVPILPGNQTGQEQ